MNSHRNRRRLAVLCAALVVLGAIVVVRAKQGQQASTIISLPHDAVATAVSSGEAANYALTTDGTVYAWGLNREGELGNGSTIDSSAPVAVRGLPAADPVVIVAAGFDHCLALTRGGVVYAWGDNEYGDLGRGSHDRLPHAVPQRVRGLPNADPVQAVSAGSGYSLALTRSGRVYAWGDNSDGELGIGTTGEQDSPVAVRGLPSEDPVIAIATGGLYSLALTHGGRVYYWGSHGVHGSSINNGSRTPALVQGLPQRDPVAAIAAEHSSTFLALTDSGRIYTWGYNEESALGNGTTSDVGDIPGLVCGLPQGDPVVAMAAGEFSALAWTRSGTVYGWGGYNGYWGSTYAVAVPNLPGSAPAAAYSEGYDGLLLTRSGRIYVWSFKQATSGHPQGVGCPAANR